MSSNKSHVDVCFNVRVRTYELRTCLQVVFQQWREKRGLFEQEGVYDTTQGNWGYCTTTFARIQLVLKDGEEEKALLRNPKRMVWRSILILSGSRRSKIYQRDFSCFFLDILRIISKYFKEFCERKRGMRLIFPFQSFNAEDLAKRGFLGGEEIDGAITSRIEYTMYNIHSQKVL